MNKNFKNNRTYSSIETEINNIRSLLCDAPEGVEVVRECSRQGSASKGSITHYAGSELR